MGCALPVVQIDVGSEDDALVLKALGGQLRANTEAASQIRAFGEALQEDNLPRGLDFQPKPGQILACHFGIGFRPPENVKTRPVLVISAKRKDGARLCTVVPISSLPPDPQRPYHHRRPDGVVPGDKYPEAWIKADLVISVGCHRLDRFKVGHRNYVAPVVPADILKEARRCVLHALGMHDLTIHW